MNSRGALLVTLASIACVGCDGYVSAIVLVVSPEGKPVPGALLRHQISADHDLARYTNDQGCGHVAGVVAPSRSVDVTVEAPGYQPQRIKVRTIEDYCFTVHLARDGEKGQGDVDALAWPEQCLCGRNSGYYPSMKARFKVTDANGSALELVGVRRSDRPPDSWLRVTDPNGCVGLSWIIPADLERVPLVVEKPGYEPAQVVVPAMEERCFAVRLSEVGSIKSAVSAIAQDQCECEILSGTNTWPEPLGSER